MAKPNPTAADISSLKNVRPSLWSLAEHLACAPKQPPLPRTNDEVLREFDAVIKSPSCNPFLRKQPDKEHPELFWDIIGDRERNWLFVVVTNRKKRNLRFGSVTDEPGGWAIAGQIWGIDAETDFIAGKMADQLFKEHRTALLGASGRRRKTASNG